MNELVIDSVVVSVYLLFILFVGVFSAKSVATSKDFSTFNFDNIGYANFVLVATMFTTAVGGGTTFGCAGKVFEGQHAYIIAAMISLVISMIFAPKIVLKLQRFHGKASSADIMQEIYGTPGQVITSIAAICTSIGYVAAQISACGYIFQYFLHISHIHGTIIGYAIMTIYTTTGGLRSVISTDIIQYTVMLAGVPLIVLVALNKIGGVQEFYYKIPQSANLEITRPFIVDVFFLTLSYLVMSVYPSFIQRLTLNRDFRQTANAVVKTYRLIFIYMLVVTIIGLCALVLHPDVGSNAVVPYMVDHIMPVGLRGLVIAALIAAVMSTADSDLNIAAITLSKNIIQPIFNIQDDAQLLSSMRYATIAVGTVAIYIAQCFSNVLDIVFFVAGFWAPIFFIPFMAGIFDVVISKKGYILTCIAGVISFYIWEITFKQFVILELNGVLFGTTISGIVFYIFYQLECDVKAT